MKLNRKWMLVIALVLSVAMATGGTMAYLSDSDDAVNVMTLGKVTIEQTETDRNGNDFSQHQPLLPTIGEVADNDGDGYWDNSNVIDKKVTVTNTGSTKAFIRTLYAFEIGTMDENYLHINWADGITPEKLGTATINGEKYLIYVVTYPDEFEPNDSAIGLKQFSLDCTANNAQVEAVSGDGEYQILVVSQGVQAIGFDTAKEALDEGFGKVDDADSAAKFFNNIGASGPAGDDNAFQDAVTAEDTNIVINLTGDVSYSINARGNEMGGANTKTITINGNGYKLSFDETDSDWNAINTNGAKLILNNVVIDKGVDKGNSAWNSWALQFDCDVEMNNVTLNHSTVLLKDAELNTVTIAHEGDYYALLVTAEGQTVTIDDLTVNGNRGIKVIDEYVSAPEKVTLNVSNAEFNTTGSKAAFLITSTAGADIILDKIDINDVAADPIHEVWVDEERENQYDLVTVTGGTKVLEGTFTSPVAGLYKEGTKYYVTSAEGFAYFSNKALTTYGAPKEIAIINILADIDMNNAPFSAVISQRGDELIINGNNHTISNLNITSGASDNTTGQASMFYVYTDSTLTVSDLKLKNVKVTADENGTGYAAAIIGYCEGTAYLNNVDVDNATVVGVKSSGVMIGHLSGSVVAEDCDLSGTVTLKDNTVELNGHYAGKYFGTIAGSATLTNCTADVTVSGQLNAANVGEEYGRKTDTGSLN